MSASELKSLRELTHLTQLGFATEMGVPFRTYQDLEGGKSAVRQIHINAAKWALVKLAASETVPTLCLPKDVADTIRAAIA